MGDYAISRRPLHPRMQVLQAPPKARATIAVVASLLAIGFVTLMISSVSDHPDFVAAEVEVGQERDPTALVADPTALTGADRFAEPAKAVTAADIVNAQEEVEVEADPTRLPKLPAKKKNPSKGGQAVSTLNRMEKNLIDLRAFIEVDQDNIEELTLTGGEGADIIKPMYHSEEGQGVGAAASMGSIRSRHAEEAPSARIHRSLHDDEDDQGACVSQRLALGAWQRSPRSCRHRGQQGGT